MKKKIIVLSLLVAVLISQALGQGYLKCKGQNIVDSTDKNVLLRGIGLGGWMVQEGYMLKTNEFANDQFQIRAKIEGLIGKENTDTFYTKWRESYIQKADVQLMKSYGFNSIRVPLHYNLFTLPIEQEPVKGQNTWLETGFKLVDSLVSWCKANQIYVILDMHAAPGGQGHGGGIADYNPANFSLWDTIDNRNKMIAVWKRIAQHYANEKCIGGYDLLNETNWDFEKSGNINGQNCTQNAPMLDLYTKLIDSIRSVDKNHIIILEGNNYANNYKGLMGLVNHDNNLVYSFHKYWSYNEIDNDVISNALSIRNTLNVPIWDGESGENSNLWYARCIQLLEDNNIGWAWWTWKKVESACGMNSVKTTPEYNNLLQYWKGKAGMPDVNTAKKTLLGITDNYKISNCVKNTEVVDAMFRQPHTSETKPSKANKIPGIIYAADYDMGLSGYAYYDTDSATYWPLIKWNAGEVYRNDGVDITVCTDVTPNNGYLVGWTKAKEWMAYTVSVDSSMAYSLNLRYASVNASVIRLSIDGKDLAGSIDLVGSGGINTWKTFTLSNIILQKGSHKLKLYFEVGGININFMQFDISKPITQVPFAVRLARTNILGDSVIVNLTFPLQTNASLTSTDFTIKADNSTKTIKSITRYSNNTIGFALSDALKNGQTVTLSYTGTAIKDTSNKSLSTFDNFPVINNRPVSSDIVSDDNTLKVYPNPANDKISFSLDENTTGLVSIYDIEGKLVLQQKVYEGVSDIDIHALTGGIYLVKVANEKKESSTIMIKK